MRKKIFVTGIIITIIIGITVPILENVFEHIRFIKMFPDIVKLENDSQNIEIIDDFNNMTKNKNYKDYKMKDIKFIEWLRDSDNKKRFDYEHWDVTEIKNVFDINDPVLLVTFEYPNEQIFEHHFYRVKSDSYSNYYECADHGCTFRYTLYQ